MTLWLGLLIGAISFALSSFIVLKDAKRFALKPPTPLIDLDRMYDVIFERLDESTGSMITPRELSTILNGFVVTLGKNNLISDDLAASQTKPIQATIDNQHVLSRIKKESPKLDVPDESILKVIDLSFAYLGEINALT